MKWAETTRLWHDRPSVILILMSLCLLDVVSGVCDRLWTRPMLHPPWLVMTLICDIRDPHMENQHSGIDFTDQLFLEYAIIDQVTAIQGFAELLRRNTRNNFLRDGIDKIMDAATGITDLGDHLREQRQTGRGNGPG